MRRSDLSVAEAVDASGAVEIGGVAVVLSCMLRCE